MLPMFMSERSIYMIPYNADTDVNSSTDDILNTIISVLNKVSFLLS